MPFRLPPRLREPSSWATVTAALVGLATQSPEPINRYIWTTAVVSAVLGVFVPEQGGPGDGIPGQRPPGMPEPPPNS